MDDAPLGPSNTEFVTSYKPVTDFTLDVDKGLQHSLMLAVAANVPHSVVVRTLKKLGESFGSYEFKPVTCVGTITRRTYAYFLSKVQYTRLLDIVVHHKKKASGKVYMVQGNGLTKIGITSNIPTRLSVLRGSSPVPLQLIHEANSTDARATEKYLHNLYVKERSHGEWFNLSPEQIEETIEYLDNLST